MSLKTELTLQNVSYNPFLNLALLSVGCTYCTVEKAEKFASGLYTAISQGTLRIPMFYFPAPDRRNSTVLDAQTATH